MLGFFGISGVEDIIKMAEFYLEKIKASTEQKSNVELSYYLFAFTNAVYNIPDYLLHDSWVKFFGNIIEDHLDLMKVYPRKLSDFIFEISAEVTKKSEALEFINFYRKKRSQLNAYKEIILLTRMRHISTHRKIATQPHFILVSKSGGRTFGLEDRSRKNPICIEDGLKFCKDCLDMMKKFVNEIRERFS